MRENSAQPVIHMVPWLRLPAMICRVRPLNGEESEKIRDATTTVKTANCHAAPQTSAVCGGNVPSWMMRVVFPEILVIISPFVFITSSMTVSGFFFWYPFAFPLLPFLTDSLTNAIASRLSWTSFLMAATWLGRSTFQSKYLFDSQLSRRIGYKGQTSSFP